jgi:hypothetical protein
MQKKVWVTSLSKNQERVTGLLGLVKKYGLGPDGHFWVDEIQKMAWQASLETLTQKQTALWVISATKAELEPASVRYGLSLLALCLQNAKGIGFPIVFVCPDHSLDEDDLPTPLKGADIIDHKNPSLGAKMVAKANTPVKKIDPGYRIDIHANPGFGIWFELGPGPGDTWNGVLAGGLTSEVTAHGVGPAGELPLKTTLEYQMQGLKLELGEDEYSAWAVQNDIHDSLSYYVRFADIPGSILFGQLPGESDAADFHLLRLV